MCHPLGPVGDDIAPIVDRRGSGVKIEGGGPPFFRLGGSLALAFDFFRLGGSLALPFEGRVKVR